MKIFLLAVIILVALIIIGHTILENPHSFQSTECNSCHVDSEQNPRTMIAPMTTLCKKCHVKVTGKSSHPVGVRPVTSRIPTDLPLQDGKITCNTCHNIHGNRFTLLGKKTYFLRRPVTGREFCISCHTVTVPGGKHSSTVGVAHVGSRFQVIDETQPIDSLSMECIACHSGITAKAVTFGIGIWSHASSSHPIGVDYQASRMANGHLKSLSSVSRKIKLFSGKVGCGTCHDIYSRLPNHLVMSNEGSRLCSSCHDL